MIQSKTETYMRADYCLYSNNLLLYYMTMLIFNIKENSIYYKMQKGHFSKFIKNLRSFFQQTSVLWKRSFSRSPSCSCTARWKSHREARAGGWLPLNDLELIKVCPLFWHFQLELQSCCVFLPNDSLPSPSTIICGDIPGTVRSWYHNQASMPGTLVVCLPQISVLSAGHKYMEPLQELPFVVSKPILEEGMFLYRN